jgi:hypothetical protein
MPAAARRPADLLKSLLIQESASRRTGGLDISGSGA